MPDPGTTALIAQGAQYGGQIIQSMFTPRRPRSDRQLRDKASRLIGKDLDALAAGKLLPDEAYEFYNDFLAKSFRQGETAFKRNVESGGRRLRGALGRSTMKSSNTDFFARQVMRDAEVPLMQLTSAHLQARSQIPQMYGQRVASSVNAVSGILGLPFE